MKTNKKILTNLLILLIGLFGVFNYTLGADETSGSSESSSEILKSQDDTVIKICDSIGGANSQCSVNRGVKEIKKTDGIETNKTFFKYLQEVISYLLGFIYIIAVIYIIYAGFLLLMGTGDIIASGKAKSNIIYVLVGIMVIYLANSIISWLIGILK